MAVFNPKNVIESLLTSADIKINGSRPWDITVHNPKLYQRVFWQGSLGFGEAYMDGWWDSPQVDELVARLLRVDASNQVGKIHSLKLVVHLQTWLAYLSDSFEVGRRHYDLGNDLFQAMLDPRLVYTCGYWKEATTLAAAQEAKLDLVCRKVGLKPGMRVLDIGGGWGSFAKYAAEKYGVSVVNITVSKEQVALANELCKGLPVENRLQDFREVNEKFDAIVSIGMFEHVGHKAYDIYMQVAHRCLADDGLFLLHTIGSDTPGGGADPWLNKYIFPNSMLPSTQQITAVQEKYFVLEDWHNFGVYYDPTLMAWHDNFVKHWPELKVQYDERFYRMWNYYLLSCAGAFRTRSIQLWQIVMSKEGVPGGYQSIR